MRIGTGIVMLVVGAILRFAVTLPNPVIDLQIVGGMLMGAGLVAFAVGIVATLRPKSTVATIVSDRRATLAPTKPYERPTR